MAKFLITIASPQNTGAGRMVCEFAASMIRRNHQVTVVHGPVPANVQPIIPELHANGVETILFPGLAFPLPWRSKRLATIIRQQNAKGVLAFNQLDRAIALRAASRAGVPSFIHLGNEHRFNGSWIWRTLKESYYGLTLRQCARMIVCVSPIVQNEVLGKFRVPEDRTMLLLNGVDVYKHKPIAEEQKQQLRSDLGIQKDEVMLINVGRIDLQKGQDILAQALAGMDLRGRKAKVVIVGGPSENPRAGQQNTFFPALKAYVAEHKLQDSLIFAGWRNDVPALLQAADGYVHSARWEGFPLAPLEAMSASKATIWTDCSGHPEGFVEGIHGWVAKKENPESLREAIERLLALTPAQRDKMGQECRRLAESRYDIQKVGEQLVEVMESCSLN